MELAIEQLNSSNPRLPKDWRYPMLGEVLKIRHGKSQKLVEDKNGKYPILGTGGLMGYANSFLYDKESVLIGRKGTIDKPQYMSSPFWTVDTLFYSEVSNRVLPKLIYYNFLLIDWYSHNEASGVPSLNASKIEKIRIPVPPEPEQKAIVQALTDIDSLITNLEKLITKKKDIKQGTMQQLLKSPAHGGKRLPGFEGEWMEECLGDYCQITSGESPSKFKIQSSGIPYFKVEQLNNGLKYAELTPYFIEHSTPVKANSIVFPKRGASIMQNKIRIFKNDSYLDTNLMALTPNDSLDNDYLFYYLSYFGLDTIADTTSVPQINNKHINPYKIRMPFNVKEQQEIVKVLSDMDEEIEGLEKKKSKYNRIKQGMMQELLTGKTRLV